MPGGGTGGGGLESIIGSVVRGLGSGMGSGMGGGMGGVMGGPMGMQGPGGMFGPAQNQRTEQTQPQEPVSEYDIDRWKRADDLDSVTTPTIQAVKDDWAKKEKKKKADIRKQEKTNSSSYLNQTREQSLEELREEKARIEKEASGTVYTPEMKKASRRIGRGTESYAAAGTDLPENLAPQMEQRNYLGLESPSELEAFVTADPINSLYLAVDVLSLSPLSMEQTKSSFLQAGHRAEAQRASDRPAAAEANAGNKILNRVGTENMQAFHEEREARKYDVRIID